MTLIDAGPDWRSEACDPEIRHPRGDIFAWRVDGRSVSRFTFPGVVARRFADSEPEPYIRGWGMGGTSSVNGLVTIRPPLDEFDEWAARADGWSWDDVLPVFRRLEDDLDYGSAEWHGRGGPVPVVRRGESEWGSGDRLLADAAFAAGHAWEPDYHRPGALGVSRTASHIRWGVRVTSYDGYVEPWREEGRVHVLSGAMVDRVVFQGGRAVGVRAIIASGDSVLLEADEIVLAGGTAATPGILQRSGLGPGDLLSGLGIPVVAELPVGAGIQDHVGFWLQVGLADARPAANGARGNAMLRYSSGLDGSRPGDLLVVAANPARPDADEAAFGVKLGRCVSTGDSRIVAANASAPSDIRMNLLGDPADLALARHAVRSSVALFAAPGGARDRFGDTVDPDWNDMTIDAWLRRCARDTSHLTGGAILGDVVDGDLRVHGVDGLRVADLSICPTVPRANTYLTAVMIGERLADALSPVAGS